MSQVARSVVIVLNKLEAQCFPKGYDIKLNDKMMIKDCTTELLKKIARKGDFLCVIICLC